MDNLNKNAINNGVILAIIGLAFQILPFYAAPQLLGSTWFGIVVMVVSLVIYILFTLDLRKKVGGFWTFKEALKGIFIMSIIANSITTVFNYLFYNFIEPDGFEKIKGYVLEGTTKTLESLGMSGDALDAGLEEATKSLQDQYHPSPLIALKNLAIAIVIGFVMSLIFAAIFKKNPPMFASTEDND
jgi:hypothetical protein